MEPEKHILNDDDLDMPLHEVLEKCKADGMPIHVASEEHGEYVVVKKDELECMPHEVEVHEVAQLLNGRHKEKVAGKVVANSEVFKALRSKYDV